MPTALERYFDRVLFGSEPVESRSDTWRQHVLDLGLKTSLVLGVLVYVPSVWLAFDFGQLEVVLGDTLAMLGIVLLVFVKRISYPIRAVAFCIVMYGLGVMLLMTVGPVSQIYLFGFSILATLLLGLRIGLFAVGLNVVTLLVTGLTGSGAESMNAPWTLDDSGAWVVLTMNFSFVNLILTLTVGLVMTALERIGQSERDARMQLVHARKLEAIGQLAGGVAHDFNNLLTVINGHSELALLTLRKDDPSRASMEGILDAGQRAANLTRQLLAFSRRQVLAPEILDPNTVLRNLDSMLRRLIGEDIQVSSELSPDVLRIEVDPGQLEQVIVNLAMNARDAMPTGGLLSISTSNIQLSVEQIAEYVELAPGAYVAIRVSDTGEGMSPEVKSHMFEPFFTTKDPGKGTGLGLATVFGIIKQSGGHIDVESAPGQGTQFEILLPAVEDEAVPAKERLVVNRKGSETILLVEDDSAVRELTRMVLETNGYTVLEAHNGKEALSKYDDTIDLVLSDVVMPEMSGRMMIEEIRREHPNVKVVFMSGYTDGAIIRHGGAEAREQLLHKPFTAVELTNAVRRALA